jgi:hypothetical protein
LDFVISSSLWLETVDRDAVAPGFVERLVVAASRGRTQGPRSIAAPYYLTDLGVRKFDDPRVFTHAHLALSAREHLSDAGEDRRVLTRTPVEDLGAVLDAFVLITGEYATARDAIGSRFEELLPDGTPALLVQVGVLFAAQGDDRARIALRRAAEVAQLPTDRFMALHRLAAAEIKRFRQPDEGVRVLDALDREVDASRRSGVLSAGDGETLLSVTANLRALGLMRAGSGRDVRAEIVRSRGLHTLDGLRQVALGEASRYGAQERINLAQVLFSDGEVGQAVEALEENVEYCRLHSTDYVGEALTALAYGQFRAGRFVEAARSAADATARIAFEASPSRLRAARQIQIAAYFRADEVEPARAVLRSMELDPLGLVLSRPGRGWSPSDA